MTYRNSRKLIITFGIFTTSFVLFVFVKDSGVFSVVKYQIENQILGKVDCQKYIIRTSITDTLLQETKNLDDGFRNLKQRRVITSLISHVKSSLNDLRGINRITNQSQLHLDIQRNIGKELRFLEKELGIKSYRKGLALKLSADIQSRLYKLQNPNHCKKAGKLYCNVGNINGLASGIHDILWCLVKAYFTGSMMVLSTTKWHYTPLGWDAYFQPLSQKCLPEMKKNKYSPWPGENNDRNRDLIVHLPNDFAEELLELGSNPLPWWYGQLLGFALKPNIYLQNTIDNAIIDLHFKSPIVGIHIRRTDKIGNEATYHAVDEYMAEVEYYYQGLIIPGQGMDEKRVFLATDDVKVFQDCIKRYPDYLFLYNANVTSMAGDLETRYDEHAIKGALVDVFLLAKTDYIVCTFSSGFCRLAYEMMQYLKPNSLDNFYSLDTQFFYAHVSNPTKEAIYNHVATREGEIDILRGDILRQPYSYSFQIDATTGKLNDGLVTAFNTRTNKTGFYPVYKAVPLFELSNVTYS